MTGDRGEGERGRGEEGHWLNSFIPDSLSSVRNTNQDRLKPMSADLNPQPQAEVSPEADSFFRRGLAYLTLPRLFWITFLFAMIVFSQLQFWRLPSTKDRANWDYFAQVISRGGIPYRDVVNIKTPLSAYIGAASIVIARPFGLSAVLATRITFAILGALTVAFTFLVASLYSGSRRTGLLAAMILCGIFMFARLNSDGIQPKTPMVLFGLISLWAMMTDRPVAAGSFGMLSALSWQPGLLFVGAGGLGFTRYLTTWRDRKIICLMIGAAMPLALFVAHLWIGGALRDFYLWCFDFNVQVYAPRGFTSNAGFVDRFTMLIEGYYSGERRYFLQAAAGIALAIVIEIYFAARSGRRGWRRLLDRAPQQQVIIAALVYLIFCRINIQGEQDLIPMLPFIGIFAAFLLISIIDQLIGVIGRLFPRIHIPAFRFAGCAVLLILVFCVRVRPVFSFEVGRKDLAQQRADAANILSRLRPGDQIWIHGETELLVVSGLTNSHKYTNLDHGKDNYLDVVEPFGFEGWFEKLKADGPRIVVFTRIANVDRQQDFLEWLNRDYEVRSGEFYDYYVRKDR